MFEFGLLLLLFLHQLIYLFDCGSKSGRPLKKHLERKGFSRLGNSLSSGSPDFTGKFPICLLKLSLSV